MIEGPTGWIVALGLAYAALGALSLTALLATRAAPLAKALVILGVSGFYIAAFFGLRTLPGYASEERLPPRFKLLSARVVEPRTIPGDPGSIYMWVEPMDENDVLSGRPRAYRRPWREKEAEALVNALKRSNEGHPQEGRTGAGQEDADWLGPNAGLTVEDGMAVNGKEAGDAASDDSVEYTPMQAPRLPSKDDQFTP